MRAVAPLERHAFLADLFERNTYWNLRTKSVSAVPVGEAWRVTLELIADKPIEIGSFDNSCRRDELRSVNAIACTA